MSHLVRAGLLALAVPLSALAAGAAGVELALSCALGWTLAALAWIDLRAMRLPDVLTLPLLLAGLSAVAWRRPEDLADHASAAILGYASFALLDLAWRRLRGQAAIGGGDAKLLAAGGAWLGVAALGPVVLIAALATLAATAALRGGTSGGWRRRVPFGPGLALGIWSLRLAMG